MTLLRSFLAVCLGAALGAVLRWVLGTAFNARFPSLPPGTLLANLLGGYLIGVALTLLAQRPDLPPEVRLFVVTGFLGGLTTFSTFSAEVVLQIQHQRWGWALATIACHLMGSLAMTGLGIVSAQRWGTP